MKIFENMLLQYGDNQIVRVLFINEVSSSIYIIDLDKVTWPYIIEKESLNQKLKDGEVTVVKKDIYHKNLPEEELTNAEKERRMQAWNIVQHFFKNIEQEELAFYSKYRNEAIQETMSAFNVSYSSVKNYLTSYWKGGKTIHSLLPNYRKCGAKGKEREAKGKKRGRPRNGGKEGVNVDDRIKNIFKVGLNRHYYTEKQNSLKTAYELTIKDFFTENITASDGQVIPMIKDLSLIPSYNQFRYWFHKYNHPKNEVSKRYGSRVFHQRHRTIIGDSTQDAGLGPGTLWQTDSTILDVHCVSSVNRSVLVGKPILHIVIDVYSRLIVGFSISFESLNSYSGAMNALYNSMTSKVDFCRRYGIEVEGKWDVACVPQRIFTDRGELGSTQIENAISNLGISIQNSPPYRPETKAIVEQSFLQITQRITPHVDGAVKSGKKLRERGEKDYRLNANLSIDEVTKILIRCILFYNNHHVLNDYVLDEAMLEVGVGKMPAKIWNYGVQYKKGILRVMEESYIKMHLLQTAQSSVTSQGLKFKKMLYVSQYSLKENWFQRAREKTWKEKIWYDPTDLSHIYTFDKENNQFIEFSLLEHLSKYENKNIEEIEKLHQFEQTLDIQAKEVELQEKMKLFQEIEEIVLEGKAKTEAEENPNLSKTKKLKGIRTNQRMEKEHQRNKGKKSIEEEAWEEAKSSFEMEEDLGMFRVHHNIEEGEDE